MYPNRLPYSMDIVTDAKIKQVVDTDLADRTIIAVAHRICMFHSCLYMAAESLIIFFF